MVIGRKFTFSDFGDKTFAEMLQILPDLMGPADNIVIHLGDAIEPVPFTQLSLNDLENLVVNKLRSESSAIISEGNLVAFNNLLAEARAGGHNNEENTGLVYDFVYVSIMEAVAAKIIKHFYLIIHPFNGNSLTLLGTRGIYTEDKQKRDAAERRLRKKADQQAKAQAKAVKEADNPKMTSQELEEFVNLDASGHGAIGIRLILPRPKQIPGQIRLLNWNQNRSELLLHLRLPFLLWLRGIRLWHLWWELLHLLFLKVFWDQLFLWELLWVVRLTILLSNGRSLQKRSIIGSPLQRNLVRRSLLKPQPLSVRNPRKQLWSSQLNLLLLRVTSRNLPVTKLLLLMFNRY